MQTDANVTDPESPDAGRRVPSLIVLGADALLGARPATPVQLAHGCQQLGYDVVFPTSWGDELVAAACLRALSGSCGPRPDTAMLCSCPHVARRLLDVGTELQEFMLSFVAPPVALAMYLRALYAPERVRITFVGSCPSATDRSIDAQLTPAELRAQFDARGIDALALPDVFEDVLPPDRRRFLSLPGGAPAPGPLAAQAGGRRLVELTGGDLALELAQHFLTDESVLLDAAPRLGCSCSGVIPGVTAASARAQVEALEPPRAGAPVVDPRIELPLERPVAAVAELGRGDSAAAEDEKSGTGSAHDPPGRRGHQNVHTTAPDEARAAPAATERAPAERPSTSKRRSSPGMRAVGPTPVNRGGEGRTFARAYILRRRTTPRSGTEQSATPASPSPRPNRYGGHSGPLGRLSREDRTLAPESSESNGASTMQVAEITTRTTVSASTPANGIPAATVSAADAARRLAVPLIVVALLLGAILGALLVRVLTR